MTDGVSVLDISQLNPLFITAGAAKRNQNGGLRVDIEYSDPSVNIYLLQTPKVRVPFGLNDGSTSTYATDKDKPATYSMQLSFDNYKNSAREAEFIRGIDAIDDRIKQLATENSKTWFKKPMKLDVIDELYRPSLKYSDDWPPLFRVKLPQWQGNFTCQFWDKDQKKATHDEITKSCHVIALLQLQGLWFVDKMFGCNWVIKQVQIFPVVKIGKECLIQQDEDEEKADSIESATAD
tara:strand:+ start:3943 stop:4650 length:708 start_codon:yes stop_codon:yes gene_type:complete